MTSKEALQELFIRVGGGINNQDFTTSRCREIVMQDLELLEIIKEWLLSFYDNVAHEFVSCVELDNKYVITKTKADKIKEFLENEDSRNRN